MRQQVFVKLPLDQLKDHFVEIVSAGYSVSLFTDWQSESINEVWIKDKVNPEIAYRGMAEFFGAKAATKDLHPIIELSAENCTDKWASPVHGMKDFPILKWDSHQAVAKNYNQNILFRKKMPWKPFWPFKEWANKSDHIYLLQKSGPLRQKLWLSPCRNQDSVTIHFTWKQEWDEVKKLLPLIEKELLLLMQDLIGASYSLCQLHIGIPL